MSTYTRTRTTHDRAASADIDTHATGPDAVGRASPARTTTPQYFADAHSRRHARRSRSSDLNTDIYGHIPVRTVRACRRRRRCAWPSNHQRRSCDTNRQNAHDAGLCRRARAPGAVSDAISHRLYDDDDDDAHQHIPIFHARCSLVMVVVLVLLLVVSQCASAEKCGTEKYKHPNGKKRGAADTR